MPVKQLIEATPVVPVLIAGWPGMGNVGLGAADHIRRRLKGTLFAKIDVGPYYLPEAIEVENGMGKIPDPPAQLLYYVAEPPLFVFEGETQVSGEAALRLAAELLDFVQRFSVETIYTGAAYAVPVSYRHPVEVYGVATDEALRNRFPALGVAPLTEGRISGLNGLLLGLAKTRGLPAACFLATMPQYAVETPNPRASKAVVQVFERILNTTIDTSELDTAIRENEQMLEEFESRVSAAIKSLRQSVEGRTEPGSPEEAQEGDERPEPHQLMERVEQLFEEAQRDKTKALLLKQELDRWGLFNLYEDRFLDLFEKKTT